MDFEAFDSTELNDKKDAYAAEAKEKWGKSAQWKAYEEREATMTEQKYRDRDEGMRDIFRAFAEGFLDMTAGTLTENEINTLALSPFVLAVELATRFLADYILGDPYFNISCPEHNLVRTRCQIALAKDMMKKMAQMDRCIKNCVENA